MHTVIMTTRLGSSRFGRRLPPVCRPRGHWHLFLRRQWHDVAEDLCAHRPESNVAGAGLEDAGLFSGWHEAGGGVFRAQPLQPQVLPVRCIFGRCRHHLDQRPSRNQTTGHRSRLRRTEPGWSPPPAESWGRREIGGAQFWVLNPGPIYLSSDSGTTWTKSGAPDGYWQSVACPLTARESWRCRVGTRTGGSSIQPYPRRYLRLGRLRPNLVRDRRARASLEIGGHVGRRIKGGCDHLRGGRPARWESGPAPHLDGRWSDLDRRHRAGRQVAGGRHVRRRQPYGGRGQWRRHLARPQPPSLNIPLNIARTAEGLELSWPATASVLALQRCSDLRAGYWSVISATPVSNGATQSVTLPLSNEHAFYRLFLP